MQISNIKECLNNLQSDYSLEINEEMTKQYLILSLFSCLNYDIHNYNHIRPEYKAGYNDGEKVDYAIMYNTKPLIAIECKSLGVPLYNYIKQLKKYFDSNISIKYGVLTDGNLYMFFRDSQNPNIMDDQPFYTFSIENLTEENIEFLNIFRFENLIDIDLSIERFKLYSFIYNKVVGVSDSFIEYIKNESGINADKEAIVPVISKLLGKTYKYNKIEEVKVDTEYIQNLQQYIEVVNVVPDIINEETEGKKNDRVIKPSDYPKNYTIFGETFIFKNWRKIVIQILNEYAMNDVMAYNKLKEDKNNINCRYIEEKTYPVYEIENKFLYEIDNGDIWYLNISNEEAEEIIDKILNITILKDKNIQYCYE